MPKRVLKYLYHVQFRTWYSGFQTRALAAFNEIEAARVAREQWDCSEIKSITKIDNGSVWV